MVGTHGRGAVKQLLLGSAAERVVRTAPCPVLAVRAKERDFIAPDALAVAKPSRRTAASAPTRTRTSMADTPVGQHLDGIEIQFLDFRAQADERRDAQDRVAERRLVGRLGAAEAAQQPHALQRLDHLAAHR